MTTTVVNVRNAYYDVYVGRPSKYGNPFIAGIDGSRDVVIRKYEQYVKETFEASEIHFDLYGKVLGCHCKPKNCHADILASIANGYELGIE